MQKVGKVSASLEFLSEILSGRGIARPGWHIKTTAPEDLQVIAILPRDDNTAWIYCKSDTFTLVESMEDAPELEPFEYTVIQSSQSYRS